MSAGIRSETTTRSIGGQHEARHTFASLLIAAGANAKAVQEFMGHSKVQTTFDTYGHLLPGSHDEVRERMDAYLLGAVEAAEDAA